MSYWSKIQIIQDSNIVENVKINTGCQLFATLTNAGFTYNVEFLVIDPNGNEALRKYVGVNRPYGNAWYGSGDSSDLEDNFVPSKLGTYTFYPDSADLESFAKFTVSTTGGGGGTPLGSLPWNWIIIGGGTLIAVIILLAGRRK